MIKLPFDHPNRRRQNHLRPELGRREAETQLRRAALHNHAH
jgi:hypothetical protein